MKRANPESLGLDAQGQDQSSIDGCQRLRTGVQGETYAALTEVDMRTAQTQHELISLFLDGENFS